MIKEKTKIFKFRNMVLYVLPSTAALMAGSYLVQINRFGASVVLMILAIAGYFYCVSTVAEKNWMDIRALFHGVWLATIALASLKLLDYQEVWQSKTWMCLAGAYIAFQVGATVGLVFGHRNIERARVVLSGRSFGKISFVLQENRLFWVCIITTGIGFLCFFVNIMIRGYIPCFSDSATAYLTFYTKFHVFAVAATCVSGLCYYCIATQQLSIVKKAVLWACILYATFLFPILVVSRGTFVVSALSLTLVVFYIHGRKLWVLITCVAMIALVYLGASMLRGYTDAQLDEFFEPSTIVLPAPEQDDTESLGSNETTFGSEEEIPSSSFTLPPKVAFLYGYLTVSHDNFNEAVENTTGYTYGARLLSPFNVILRSQRITMVLDNAENYLVRPHLNTANVASTFYYDFHEWGVVIGMLIWSVVFGLMQRCVDVFKGPFSMLVLGNAMPPIALSFFSGWFANFTQWLLWGTILLLAIGSCLKIDRRGKKTLQ